MDIVLPPDFKEFLNLLKGKSIQYLLIGGYAVGYHGYPRATNDMDIWIAIAPKTAEQMVLALREFGFVGAASSRDRFNSLLDACKICNFDALGALSSRNVIKGFDVAPRHHVIT